MGTGTFKGQMPNGTWVGYRPPHCFHTLEWGLGVGACALMVMTALLRSISLAHMSPTDRSYCTAHWLERTPFMHGRSALNTWIHTRARLQSSTRGRRLDCNCTFTHHRRYQVYEESLCTKPSSIKFPRELMPAKLLKHGCQAIALYQLNSIDRLAAAADITIDPWILSRMQLVYDWHSDTPLAGDRRPNLIAL